MNTILKYIMLLLSYSPFLCCSDDDNFGSNEEGFSDFFQRIRFSLFSFNFGAYIFYFLSYKKGQGFKKIHKLNLNDYDKFKDEDKDRVKTKQQGYLDNQETKNTDIDKEFLKYLFENEHNRKNAAYNKINSYTTIILAIIPLILLFYKKETFINASIIIKVLTVILSYIIINIAAFILQSNKVKGCERVKYSTLKESSDKNKEIIKAYYMDWQNIKRESNRVVSFVTNIEVYIRGAIIVSALISIFNMIDNKESYKNKILDNTINEISISKLGENDKDTIDNINKINENLSNKRVEKIVIIYRDEEILNDKSFNTMCEYFNLYKKDIIKLYDKNEDTKDDKIKILLLED